MKKTLVIIFAGLSMYMSAQDSLRKPFNCYVATSLSLSNGSNFNTSSYTSVELGACYKYLAFGIVTGRGNLDFTTDDKTNYWSEVKVIGYREVKSFKCFILAGWGQYYNTTHSFIEYGGGFLYSIRKIDLCMQVSSWDNTVYVSPGITFNMSFVRRK